MARRSRRRRQLAGLGGVPAPVWIGLGAVVVFALFAKRKEIAVTIKKALTEAEKKILRTVVPAKGEEFVDYAFELAPKYGINPNFVLAFLAVESGFKLAPNETGDKLARCLERYSGTRLATAKSLPGVETKEAYDAYLGKTCQALVPTTTGWGFGPMQLDWVSHSDFLKTPAGKTARGQMEYAIKLIVDNINTIKRAFPNIDPATLFSAVIAAYNAGAGGAVKALRDGRDLTTVTAASWYIPRVQQYMQTLSSVFGGNATNLFA